MEIDAIGPHEHFRSCGAVKVATHPAVREIGLYTSPIKLAQTPGRIDSGAPCLGDHNEQVFQGLLELSGEEYARLREEGVIR